jgi:peptide/nickel transport system ATP-binding protein
MAPLLEIANLSIAFRTPRGRVRAVKAVDLCIEKGTVAGLVGESGSGKTTMASAVMRLLPAEAEIVSGRIILEGTDILTLGDSALRDIRGKRIAMIFQDPMTSLNPIISIGRQMVEVQYRDRASVRLKLRRSADLLARVGISDPERRLRDIPQALSGGMRQRVAIAMSLLNRPDLIIADEPTTALDATLEAQVVDLLRDLQGEFGTTMLFVSHNLGLVAELGDQVAVMYLGELVEQGPLADVFSRPAHPYTQALLRCDPARIAVPTRILPTIEGEIGIDADRARGCVFSDRCPAAMRECSDVSPAVTLLAPAHSARCHLLGAAR